MEQASGAGSTQETRRVCRGGPQRRVCPPHLTLSPRPGDSPAHGHPPRPHPFLAQGVGGACWVPAGLGTASQCPVRPGPSLHPLLPEPSPWPAGAASQQPREAAPGSSPAPADFLRQPRSLPLASLESEPKRESSGPGTRKPLNPRELLRAPVSDRRICRPSPCSGDGFPGHSAEGLGPADVSSVLNCNIFLA